MERHIGQVASFMAREYEMKKSKKWIPKPVERYGYVSLEHEYYLMSVYQKTAMDKNHQMCLEKDAEIKRLKAIVNELREKPSCKTCAHSKWRRHTISQTCVLGFTFSPNGLINGFEWPEYLQ